MICCPRSPVCLVHRFLDRLRRASNGMLRRFSVASIAALLHQFGTRHFSHDPAVLAVRMLTMLDLQLLALESCRHSCRRQVGHSWQMLWDLFTLLLSSLAV